jgi:hypothetical protein
LCCTVRTFPSTGKAIKYLPDDEDEAKGDYLGRLKLFREGRPYRERPKKRP